jgi:hypothetical protein
LVQTFEFDELFRTYIREEIVELKQRTQIASGKLSAVTSPFGIKLRAGEVPYFVGESTLRLIKRRKSDGGPFEDHAGQLVLTNARLLFDSATKPARIPYRSILAWSGSANRISLSVADRPELRFVFPPSSKLVAETFGALLRLHHQPLAPAKAEGSDHHIPRDVRQQVWQRSGGKCAECLATDYLEFDHIVPPTEGGDLSERNVRLLCRRCNLKKFDEI